MHDPVDLSALRGELEALETETFEVLDYLTAEDMTAVASCGSTSTAPSTSCTNCF